MRRELLTLVKRQLEGMAASAWGKQKSDPEDTVSFPEHMAVAFAFSARDQLSAGDALSVVRACHCWLFQCLFSSSLAETCREHGIYNGFSPQHMIMSSVWCALLPFHC